MLTENYCLWSLDAHKQEKLQAAINPPFCFAILFCRWLQVVVEVESLEEPIPHIVWQTSLRVVRSVDEVNRLAGGIHNDAAVFTFRNMFFDLTA